MGVIQAVRNQDELEALSRDDNEVDWQEIRQASERPLGVTILSCLHLVGGIALAFLILSQLSKRDQVAENIERIGFSSTLLVLSLCCIAVLLLGSGVGMMMRKAWGWFLGVFYYLDAVLRNANALFMISELEGKFGPGNHSPDYYFLKHGGRVVIYFLLFLYLFRPKVLAYMQLAGVHRGKLLLYLGLVYAAQQALFALASLT